MKLFCSYSNDDISHVNSFASAFKKENRKDSIFIASSKHPDDDSLELGKKWREQLRKEILDSDGVVLFLSKSFFKSEEVIDFEWPIIEERKKKDPNFLIFTILIDDIDLKNKPNFKILEGDEYCNTKETRLKILRGSAYNLELQNISKRINQAFYKNIKIGLPSSTFARAVIFGVFSITLIFGVSNFYISKTSNNNLDENKGTSEIVSISTTTTQLSEADNIYTDFSQLGIGDCLIIDESLNGPMPWSPEYLYIEEIVSCNNLHNVEIISKLEITRINSSEVLIPGSRLGFYVDTEAGGDCYEISDGQCDGVVVSEIEKYSAIEDTSLKPGNIITSFNGFDINNLTSFTAILNHTEPNVKSTFTYYLISEDQKFQVIDESIIPDRKIFPNSKTTIDNQLNDYCAGEVHYYQNIDTRFTDLDENRITFALPVYNKEDFSKDSFTVLCLLMTIEISYNEENNLNNIRLIENKINFTNLFYEEYGFYSVQALFDRSNNIYAQIPKSFSELVVGDCFDWNKYNLQSKATDSEFITFVDCSIQYQNAQVLDSFAILENELLDNNLLIGSDEFYDFLSDKCLDVHFNNWTKEEVAIGLASRWLDDNGNVVKSNLNKVLWDRYENNINVKCILTYTKGTGFEKFKNAFTSVPSKNNIINLDFAYCPKYTFTGSGYNFRNNFISTEEMSLEWIIPSWNIGKYPIEKIALYTKNENISIAGTEGLTGYTFDPINKDRDLFNDRLEGTLPFMFEVIGDFSGDVTFVVMGEDAGGGNAWAECTTKVVRNASLNEIIEITETGSISKNSWDSELSFEINSNENLNNLSLPLIQSLEHKKDQEGYNLEISLSQLVNKKEIRDIFVKYVLCEENRSINCIDSHDSEKNYLYYSSKEFGIPNIEDDFLQNISIPLFFESCNENSKKIDFNCLDIGKNYFALLEYIFVNFDSPYDCNIAYKGFTKNIDYLRESNPEGAHIKFYKDIRYGENQSNTSDSEYEEELCSELSNTEIPYTQNALLFNYHYFPSFDFSTIFNGKLYNGSPYFNLED